MANTYVPPVRAPGSDFSLGRVFDRATAIFTRNFLLFSLVTLVAYIPSLLLPASAGGIGGGGGVALTLFAVVLTIMLSLLSQAVLVYASFQDMRGRAVNLGESFNVALVRLVPILGVMFLAGICTALGFMLLIVPGLILMTMWFVAIPACVVERTGPWESMQRSADLTKGHRWQVFGIFILLYVVSIIVGLIIAGVVGMAGSIVANIVTLIWNGIWGAFFAILVVVTYYELRVAKEGIDIEQIASVFD